MEFETNRPVSDEERRLAEAKQIILQPLHSDVAPEAPRDSEIAARHVIEPPISNTANDMEESSTQLLPTKSLLVTHQTASLSIKKLILLGLGIITFATLAVLAVIQ